jgi:nucleoside-diphosphate-sugar epimerase
MAYHIVVTGAGGFVGGFVARWLARRGYQVTAVSRRMAERERDDAPLLRWLTANLEEPRALPAQFDALIHCAAEIPQRVPDADALYASNISMAKNVFDAAAAARTKTAVYLSSMSAYGQISVPLVTEDLTPGELDTYGRAKRDAEALLEQRVRMGLPSGLTLRLPGTVGKGSHSNFLSGALARVLKGDAVEARNPEALFNNIVYVGDLAAFVERWCTAPRAGYVAANLAASSPVPIREVFELLVSCAGTGSTVSYATGGKAPFLIAIDCAISLGYQPATVRASVEAFVRDCMGRDAT